MPVCLIFNADDYGLTPAVSRAIRDAHLNGVVTSTTCMMNLPDTAADIRIAQQETPRLGLGVHLVLTAGRPVLPPERVRSIIDNSGRFLRPDDLISKLDQIVIAEVKAEWRAQVKAFLRAIGQNPTHLDSHHHSSYFSPALFRAMLELAREYHCAVRLPVLDKTHWEVTGLPETVTPVLQKKISALVAEFKPPCPDTFFADFYDENATRMEIERILSTISDGTAEIMCHPGYNDPALKAVSSYNHQREAELNVLTAPEVLNAIRLRDMELVHFGKLA